MNLLMPDLGKIVYLLIGAFVAPKIIGKFKG